MRRLIMWRDDSFLFDIVYAAKRILEYTHGVDWKHFKENEMLQDAVIRKIGIIGEASRQLSDKQKTEIRDVDWNDIIGMRNRIVHDYRHVRLPKVWEVIQEYIPDLIGKLEPLLPEEPEE